MKGVSRSTILFSQVFALASCWVATPRPAGTSSLRCSMSSSSSQRPSVHYPQVFEQLPSMAGKTVVITGCSRGLGYVTALALAKKGASLFLLNRRSARANDALIELQQASSGPSPQLVECDLLDFANVREAAANVREIASEGIDVLCCNAGIMLQPDEASKDGYDITLSTNHLSHFLLTKELMPALEKAASLRGEARIVMMSSASGFGGPAFDTEFLSKKGGSLGGKEESYNRYHQSKLANLLFASALDEKLRAKKSKIKAVACTPGVCGTDMFVHASSIFRPGQPVDLSVVQSVEDGSIGQLICICDPSVRSGDLWGPTMGSGGAARRISIEPPTVMVDEKSKKALWESSEEAVGTFAL